MVDLHLTPFEIILWTAFTNPTWAIVLGIILMAMGLGAFKSRFWSLFLMIFGSILTLVALVIRIIFSF